MQTATALLTYLQQRLGLLGVSMLLLFGAALAVATGLTFLTAVELLASSSEPIQLAPVRWGSHRC